MRAESSFWTAAPMKCFIGTLFVFAVFNLPFQYAEYVPVMLGEFNELKPNLDHSAAQESGAILGGWPARYVTLLPPGGGLDAQWSQASWSLTSLLANAFAALLAALLAALALAGIAARWSHAATALVGTVALGWMGFGGYQAAGDLAIANQLVPHGPVYRSAIVPIWLTRVMPSYSLQAFSRTRGVMLHQYDAAAVASIVNLPSLHSLGFWKTFPTIEELQPLMLQPRLRRLLIYDADVDDSLQQLVATQTDLRLLELVGCRGLSSGLAQLQGRIDLHHFDASDSDFPISTLSAASWTQNLRHLRLSPPASGSVSLELRDYLYLKSLSIHSLSDRLNPDAFTLRLQTLPQLQSLALVNSQKFDLNIINAPRLREVRIDESEDQMAGIYHNHGPVGLWLEKLRLIDTPSLRRLSCYGLDLTKIEIRDAPNLIEVAINANVYGRPPHRDPHADQLENLSALITDLAACDGPPIVTLSSLPLQGLDLSPLANNKRIRELGLAGTGIHGDQLKTLLTLPSLTALDVRNCPISNAEAAEVLTAHPQLKQFQVSSEHFERIEIIDRNQLVKFATTPIPQASVVRIIGSPYLDSELLIGNRVKELSIQDAESLRGVSVNGPIPQGATLQGLRDLQFCALGGANVDDRLCASIWQCPKLTHLTLAYAKLSREAIFNISYLKNLNALILPGCDIDDSVTRDWVNLRQLRDVDLSHTAIATQTVALLLSRPNLQRLAINYVGLKKSDLRGLPDVQQLIELEVAGTGLEEQTLRAITSRGMLDRLDLSDCELGPEMIRILASKDADSLVFLGIRNCGLSDAEIRSIIAARPRVAVDIEGNSLSEAFRKELAASNRLLSRRDRTGYLNRIVELAQAANAANAAELSLSLATDATRGRIDVHQFAPPNPLTALR